MEVDISSDDFVTLYDGDKITSSIMATYNDDPNNDNNLLVAMTTQKFAIVQFKTGIYVPGKHGFAFKYRTGNYLTIVI